MNFLQLFAIDEVADKAKTGAEQAPNALVQSFTKAWESTIAFLPDFLAAVLVMVAGYVIARLVAKAITALCERLGLQRAAERSELKESMNQVGIQRTVPQVVGLIIFWLLIGVFATAAFKILGLQAIEDATKHVVNYLPKVLGATVIVVVGLMVASLLRGVIATSANRVGLSYASQLASGFFYILSLMVFMAAFDQLELKFELLNYAILIILGGLAIGFGLSFGLGGRDVVGGILAGYYIRQRMHSGDQVSVAGLEGTVREVGPVATIIETDENGLMHRHSVPNTKMLNEAVR